MFVYSFVDLCLMTLVRGDSAGLWQCRGPRAHTYVGHTLSHHHIARPAS